MNIPFIVIHVIQCIISNEWSLATISTIMHNIQQPFLNHYFADTWNDSIGQYIYSGFAICDKISPSETVIDVGCGANHFKSRLSNVVGIDPANTKADIVTTIEDYTTHKRFDVALCLGSINFGNHEFVKLQIAHVVELLKPHARIYWRCNPGEHDHPNKECNAIDFYPWTFERHHLLAVEFGFKIKSAAIDSNKVHKRLYCEWHR